jgi:hypothetical protein
LGGDLPIPLKRLVPAAESAEKAPYFPLALD